MQAERRSLPLVLLALVLLAAAGFLSSAGEGGTYLTRLLLVAGVGALGWGAVQSWSLLRVLFFRMREVAEPGPSLTWLLTGLILLTAAVGLSIEPQRRDLTSRGLHSLSDVSGGLLEDLPVQVEMIGVYQDGNPMQQTARDILAAYRTTSRDIRTRLLDPERRPQEARELGLTRSGGVLVRADSVQEMVTELTESALTQAILRVSNPDRPVAAILEGHGENLAGGTVKLRQLLREAGLRLLRLPLAEVGRVPDDVRVLLVLGPRTPLLPGEIQAVEEFLGRGGRLGLFVDPESPTGLEGLLRMRGVEVGRARIRDEGNLTRSLGLGPETIAVRSFGEHEITQPLPAGLVLRGATRVGLAPNPIWGTDATDLMRTGPEAFLLSGDSDGEEGVSRSPQETGSLPLGVAMKWSAASGAEFDTTAKVRERPNSRVVVVGDSDLLRDDTIDLYGNREFVSKLVGWLAEQEFLLNFERIDPSGTPLRVGLAGLRTLFYLLEMVLPLLLFGFGIFLWVRRR